MNHVEDGVRDGQDEEPEHALADDDSVGLWPRDAWTSQRSDCSETFGFRGVKPFEDEVVSLLSQGKTGRSQPPYRKVRVSQLYKSPEVKQKLRAVTERMRDEVPGEKIDHYIQTSFGDTYVLEMGDPSQETLVLLHGAMTNHAVILSMMRHLVGRYHLIIPDLPGHAGWSSEQRLDPMGDDYGRWLLEVLDELKVDRCHFMGLSYGCFVANRLIALAPERVDRAFFMVPAGFILLSAWAVIKHFLLWVILLGLTGKDRFFYRIIDAIFTERPEGAMVEFFRLTMTGMKPVSGKHKLVDPKETKGFSRPLYILGCEHDFAVDPRILPERAAAAYPGSQVEILPGSKHSPPLDDATLRMLADKVSGFLSASPS